MPAIHVAKTPLTNLEELIAKRQSRRRAAATRATVEITTRTWKYSSVIAVDNGGHSTLMCNGSMVPINIGNAPLTELDEAISK
jgi:hypothetical protein